jgi:hypothetical protein
MICFSRLFVLLVISARALGGRSGLSRPYPTPLFLRLYSLSIPPLKADGFALYSLIVS